MPPLDPDMSPDGRDAALVNTFSLLSAAIAAVRVLRAVRDRRDGHDPSAQEASSDAIAGLTDSADALQELLLPALIAAAVTSDHEDVDARTHLVRRFDEMHRASEAALLLHRIHQRLLSLYPGVPEELVEQVRLLEREMAEAGAMEGPAGSGIDPLLFARAHAFGARLQHLLRSFFSA